jgi:CheY-like chemotaxis protein
MSYRTIQPDARILIVEDDDILRGLHEAVLSLAGYGTDSAAVGEEALGILAASDFDLVLTDRNMPRLDGVELIRAIRANGNLIPIMMVSGSLADGGKLPDDVAREVIVALPKPVRSLELVAGVARALEGDSRLTEERKRTEVLSYQQSDYDEYSSN